MTVVKASGSKQSRSFVSSINRFSNFVESSKTLMLAATKYGSFKFVEVWHHYTFDIVGKRRDENTAGIIDRHTMAVVVFFVVCMDIHNLAPISSKSLFHARFCHVLSKPHDQSRKGWYQQSRRECLWKRKLCKPTWNVRGGSHYSYDDLPKICTRDLLPCKSIILLINAS